MNAFRITGGTIWLAAVFSDPLQIQRDGKVDELGAPKRVCRGFGASLRVVHAARKAPILALPIPQRGTGRWNRSESMHLIHIPAENGFGLTDFVRECCSRVR